MMTEGKTVLKWNITKADYQFVHEIAQRAVSMAVTHGRPKYKVQDVEMDITATHLNGCRLRLAELAAAPEFEFAHDVFGIRNHLNRETGKLEDCFMPRFAA
jgi:hypothetical protein